MSSSRDYGKDHSVLPSHHTSRPEETESLEALEEKYNLADAKLLRLEEELDVLLHCAHLLREKRTELTLGRLKYSNETPSTPILDKSDQFIDDYLALAVKSKAMDDMIKALKEECAPARSECNYFLTKIRRASRLSPGVKLRQTYRNKNTLAHGGPESGFTDREAVAERIMSAESTATSVAGVVGAFGAGITYTTLFSATRGRMDLISWAFTCFILVVIDSAAMQLFALPRHGQLDKIFRMEYSGSPENRLLIYMLFVGLPMIAGFLLLAVSVALVDGDSIATRAAGYLPVAVLGYFVILMLLTALGAIIVRLLPRRLLPGMGNLPADARKYYPSFIHPVKEKLYFLPGGPGYALYRQKHLCARKS